MYILKKKFTSSVFDNYMPMLDASNFATHDVTFPEDQVVHLPFWITLFIFLCSKCEIKSVKMFINVKQSFLTEKKDNFLTHEFWCDCGT